MDFEDAAHEDDALDARLARWQRQYEGGDVAQRRAAIEALCELAREQGAEVSAAQSVLGAALADEDDKVGDSASWALRYLAPFSIGALIQALDHAWAPVRRRAAQALGNVGAGAHAAVRALRTRLDDDDEAVSCRAAWALGLIGDSGESTLARLWRMSAEQSAPRRASALHALGNLGKKLGQPTAWQVHLPLLHASLVDADDNVRRNALYAVQALGLPPQQWVDLLGALLARETSEQTRSTVLRKLQEAAPVADLSAIVPTLLGMLKPGVTAVRGSCDVLGAMRPAPLQALPALEALLADDDLAFVAARAIWRIAADAQRLLPVLDRLFDTQEEVCDLICEMGPAAAPLLPRVLAALGGDVWDVQWAAADAAAAITPSDDESGRVLLHALGHDSPLVRSGAARALARAGAAHVPALRRLVADDGDDRAAWAAFTLGLIAEAAAEALGELRRGMRAPQAALANACQIAVARIGSLDSLSLLIELVADADVSLPRAAAAEALGMLGPAAMPAQAALLAASTSEDEALADAARQALAQIGGRMH